MVKFGRLLNVVGLSASVALLGMGPDMASGCFWVLCLVGNAVSLILD